MSTGMQSQPQTSGGSTQEKSLVELLREMPPDKALELILAEHERTRARNSEVAIGEDGLVRAASFNGIWRMATLYAASDLVPDHFRGKPNNCFIGIQMAMRCRCDPFAFLQNCYIVHGRPGIEAKLAIAMLKGSGQIVGVPTYTMTGQGTEKHQCICSVVDAKTGQTIQGPPVTWDIVTKEGWNKDKPTKTGGTQVSKWNSMRDLMFMYRAAMFLIRTTYPDVLMGMQTTEELDELPPETGSSTPPTRAMDLSNAGKQSTTEKTPTPSEATSDPLADFNSRAKPQAGNGSSAKGVPIGSQCKAEWDALNKLSSKYGPELIKEVRLSVCQGRELEQCSQDDLGLILAKVQVSKMPTEKTEPQKRTDSAEKKEPVGAGAGKGDGGKFSF